MVSDGIAIDARGAVVARAHEKAFRTAGGQIVGACGLVCATREFRERFEAFAGDVFALAQAASAFIRDAERRWQASALSEVLGIIVVGRAGQRIVAANINSARAAWSSGGGLLFMAADAAIREAIGAWSVGAGSAPPSARALLELAHALTSNEPTALRLDELPEREGVSAPLKYQGGVLRKIIAAQSNAPVAAGGTYPNPFIGALSQTYYFPDGTSITPPAVSVTAGQTWAGQTLQYPPAPASGAYYNWYFGNLCLDPSTGLYVMQQSKAVIEDTTGSATNPITNLTPGLADGLIPIQLGFNLGLETLSGGTHNLSSGPGALFIESLSAGLGAS